MSFIDSQLLANLIASPLGAMSQSLAASQSGCHYYTPPNATSDPGVSSNAVVIDSQNRAIIAGPVVVSGQSYIGVIRLKPVTADEQYDLELDTTFGTAGWCLIQAPGATGMNQQGLALQTDGKILVSGVAIIGGAENSIVARLTTAGVLDTTFNTTGYRVFMPTGGTQAIAFAVGETPDGHIIAAGGVLVAGVVQSCATRFTSAGAIDTTWGSSGHAILTTVANAGGAIWGLSIDATGRVVMAAQSTQTFSTTVAGTNTAGQPVLNVASVGGAAPNGIVVGATLLVGTGGTQETFLAEALAGTAVNGGGNNLAHTHTNGEPVVVTWSVLSAIRLTAAGALDTSFNGTGFNTGLFAGLASIGFTAQFQSDGRIIVSGNGFVSEPQPIILRFNTDGTIDTTFGIHGNGVAYPTVLGGANGAIIQPDDRIVLSNVDAGSRQTTALRLLPNGQMDESFGIDGNLPFAQGNWMVPNGVGYCADGSLVLAGVGIPIGGIQSFSAARLTSSGHPAADGYPALPISTPAAPLPALPANGAVAQPAGAAGGRTVWSALTGDGATTQFSVPHNLGTPTVRARGYSVAGSTPTGERKLSFAPNPLDPLASILVRFPVAPSAGQSFYVVIEA